MTVLLIRPRGPQFYKTSGPDLGLGYLLTALQKEGLGARVVDLIYQSDRDLRQALGRERYSLIGFKLYSKDVSHFREIMATIRKELGEVGIPPIVAGGPLPTGLAEEFLERFPEVSYAFRGEAEDGFPMLAKHLEAGEAVFPENVPGLLYRQNGKVAATPQHFPADLDALGFPDYSLMPPSSYPADYTTGDVYVTIATSRGCPYSCTYCAGPLANGRRLRKHSPGYVVDLADLLNMQYGARTISFVDDNLTADVNHAKSIFELIIQRKLGIRWRAPNGIRLDTLDREMVKLMELSGCVELYLGIESGSPRILTDMNRRVTVETYREKVRLLAENTKIRLLGFFILGYPTERDEDVRQSIDLAIDLPLHRAAFFFFTPHPGTQIYNEMRQNNELPDDIWNSLFYDKPSLGSRYIRVERLNRLQRTAYFRFYLRPRIIRNLLGSISSPGQFVRLVRKIFGTLLGF